MINSGDLKRMETVMNQLFRKLLACVLFLAVCLLLVGCNRGDAPTPETDARQHKSGVTLISNARIYTLDPGSTVIEAGSMAFSDSGEVLALGDDEPMAGLFPEARRIDMAGKSVLPGLIDSHAHLYGLALSFTRANLSGSNSKAEVMERLREFESDLPEGAWLLGRGWDQNDWPEQAFPSSVDLDAEFPGRPVWLRRIDGHAAWANSAAMAQADRDLEGEWQPEGGLIQRDSQGQPTGIFIDGAMNYVEQAVPETSPELVAAALDLATANLVSLGLTGVHDAGIGRDVIELYQEKIAKGDFPIRVYAMADGMGDATDWLCQAGALSDPSGRLEMRAVKLYADGALGSRGAALLHDYSDEPGNQGLMFISEAEMESAVRQVIACGLQVSVHAIGDAANRQVLDAYENAISDFPDNPGRHRIEHAQVLHADDIPRFAKLGVIAAMQPTHATSDMYWADERLGEDRLSGAYAWKSLLDSGAVLTFGSDFPVEEVNPMLGIYAAVTRQDLKDWPQGGWQPGERLSREQAVRAFTADAAYSGFSEQLTGSLEVGKRADFIVLDRDIMQVPVEEIPQTLVIETWVDGQRVFTR
jgi:predicted amidohydrolase YtcJ